ncbi:MAG: hypothetical protein SV186_02740 [Candidatus Nanohaloarchaea archaeon]|nr:hypothetical protein [Candidatus Nanohaloarchaea archaeon]
MPRDIAFWLGERPTDTGLSTIDVELPEEWLDDGTISSDELGQIRETIRSMDDHYSEIQYTFTGINVEDDGDGNRYRGRDGKRPQIALTDFHSPAGTLAHELGHDIEKYHIGREQREESHDLLASKTFSEFFAHLNALHFMDEQGREYSQHFTWDPAKEKYADAWETLDELIDLDHRKKEYKKLHSLASNDNDEIDDIKTQAHEIASIGPAPYELNGHALDSSDQQQDMFLINLPYDDIAGQKESLARLTTLLEDVQARDNGLAANYVKYANNREDTTDDPLHQTIADATDDYLDNHPVYSGLEDHVEDEDEPAADLDDARTEIIEAEGVEILEYALDMNLEQLKNDVAAWRRTLEQEAPVDHIYDAISDEEYGYKRNGSSTDHDSYVDFPHNVGGQLAEEYLEAGTEPLDVVKDPQPYLDACQNAIKQEIADQIGM